MSNGKIDTFCPLNKKQWRNWLQKNHSSNQGIWLIYYKQNTLKTNLSWSEAVDEALCFGWIDSTKKPIDEEKYMQLFSKRKAKSPWSKVNKDKAQHLINTGKMTEAGFQSIEIAKQNGSWIMMDAAEALIIPEDLNDALETKQDAKEFFLGLSNSSKKSLLSWLILAKRSDTRIKRINEIVENAAQKLKPKQFR